MKISLGWSDRLQVSWDSIVRREDWCAARIAAIERSAAVVWGAAEDVGPSAEAHPDLAGIAVALATYGGALADAPISESLAVGDWVAVDRGLRIRAVVPRVTALVRRIAGGHTAQLVAANVDRVFVVTAIGADFSPRRIERYLAAIREGGAEPAIVVNKADVSHDRADILAALDAVAPGVAVVLTSAIGSSEDVARDLAPVLAPTVALVGSSGVGKSTLVNRLCGADHQETSAVRATDGTGRHTTSRREIFVAPRGSLLVDTPGMRELGLFDAADGLAATFADVETLAARCRFGDCAHGREPGCAIAAALEDGTLPPDRYDSYTRLQAELAHEARRTDLRAARASKQRSKNRSRSTRQRNRLARKLGLKEW